MRWVTRKPPAMLMVAMSMEMAASTSTSQFDPDTSTYFIARDDQNPWKFYFNVLFGFVN